MLAKSKAKSPKEIAEGVGKTREHAALEQQLRELRGEVDTRQAEVRALTARSRDTNRLDREVVAKGTEVAELRERRDELARRLAPMRAEHGRRVVEAFRLLRKETAAQLLEPLRDLRAGFAVLDAVQVEIERSGGSAERIAAPWLAGIEGALQRAAKRNAAVQRS